MKKERQSLNAQNPVFRLERLLRLACFIAIALAILCLYGFTAYHTWLVRPWGEVAVVLLIIAIMYAMAHEAKELNTPDEGGMGPWMCLKNFVCVLIGAALAYTLNVDLGIGAVLAASLVSLMAAILVPTYSVPIALGGFVGMTSSRLLVGYAELSYAAAIAGFIYLGTDRIMQYVDKSGSSDRIYRDGKATHLEGGVRVNAFMRWKGVLDPGSRAQDIVHVTDLFTTTARLAGAEEHIPTDRLIDGVDQTPVLFLGETHGRRDYVFIYEGPSLRSIVKQQYKFHLPLWNRLDLCQCQSGDAPQGS